jgi:hypothetical protein
MKKILLILCIIWSSICSAQTPPAQGSYTTNPQLDKFVGTWIWISGSDTMKIVLQKQFVHHKTPYSFEYESLIGWHRYVKNGIQVESSLQYIGSPYNSGHSTLLGSTIDNPRQVRFTTFKDITRNKKSNSLYFTLQNNSLTIAYWSLKNSEGLAPKNFIYDFTVPMLMTFTKQ